MAPLNRLAKLCALTLALACSWAAQAAEHISLSNGFDFLCDHRTVEGDRTRLYLAGGKDNFFEVPTADITAVDTVPLPQEAGTPQAMPVQPEATQATTLTASALRELLTTAGLARNLDVDLLACVVHAESGGRTRATSRSGARGLMQLIPGTAAGLGVTDSFEPVQNINGGTAYLNTLLLRYHDNLALALAAYNAGPRAVDRYHGVPPYRETRAYVARIIHEFNHRKAAMQQSQRAASKLPIPGASHTLD